MPIIKQNLTTVNRYVGGNTKKWIVIHNVGTKPQYEGAAYANTRYFKSVNRQASAHYFIDNGDVIWQCVRDNDRAWSVGDSWSRNGCTNDNSINIEVCGNWEFSDKEIENLAWLVKRLMKKYDIDEKHICRHYDCTTKRCPAFYTDTKTWNHLKQQMFGITPRPAPVKPTPEKPNDCLGGINVTYAAKVGGKWLPAVMNFNNRDGNGYAGIPNKPMTAIMVKVNKGSVRYRVHLKGKKGWLPWVTGYNKNDFDNGYAGDGKTPIDGFQIYYKTPKGYCYQQAWYRSQTTDRAGWLGVCCDDGKSVSGYDGWSGIYGEGMDRLQIAITNHNPFK